jgi:NADH-quinone oxidoreductase subunit J
MEFKTLLFYMFAAVLLMSAVRVITARNPVHAVLFLVLAFFNAAGIWLMLDAEFLAIALIMVYVGAVMVLFLFVVMMLDINIESMRRGFWNYLPMGGLVGLVIVMEMGTVLSGRYFNLDSLPNTTAPDGYSNTKELGRILYTDYAYPFELASVILLVAIIAAVVLTHRQRKDTKTVAVSKQLATRRGDRLRIVSMASATEPEVVLAAEKEGDAK